MRICLLVIMLSYMIKCTTDKENDEVKDERSKWREKQIIVGNKELKDNEKEKEGEKQKEKEEFEKNKEEKKVRVKKKEKREKKQLQMRERKCHTLWYLVK